MLLRGMKVNCVNCLQEDQYLHAIHLGPKALTLAQGRTCQGMFTAAADTWTWFFASMFDQFFAHCNSFRDCYPPRNEVIVFSVPTMNTRIRFDHSWVMGRRPYTCLEILPADNVGIGHSVMGGSFKHSGFSDRKSFSALGWSIRPTLRHVSEWTALLMHQTWHLSAKVGMGCPVAPPCIMWHGANTSSIQRNTFS